MKKAQMILVAFFFVLISSFLFVINVKADEFNIVTDGYFGWEIWDAPYAPIKKISGTDQEVFCGQFNKDIPISCKSDSKWKKNGIHSAAIGWIVNQKYDYGIKEVLINYYLGYIGETYDGRKGVSRYNEKGIWDIQSYSYIYISQDFYNKYLREEFVKLQQYLKTIPITSKNAGAAVKFKGKKIDCNSEGECTGTLHVYNLGEKIDRDFSLSFDGKVSSKEVNSCKLIDTSAGNERLDCEVKLKLKKGTTIDENLKISVTATSLNETTSKYKIYSVDRYSCGSDYQKVFKGVANPMKVSSEASVKKDKIITDEKPTCETRFTTDKYARIQLYEDLKKTENLNYTNLLNFNITDAELACSEAECNYNSSTACFAGNNDIDQNFDMNDLSCHNKTIEISAGEFAYCLTNFNLESKIDLSETKRNSRIGINYIDLDIVSFSDRLMHVQDTPLAAVGTLQQQCYFYHGNKNTIESFKEKVNWSSNDNKKYTDAVKDVELEYFNETIKFDGSFNSMAPSNTIGGNATEKYYSSVSKIKVNYNFSPIYIDRTINDVVKEPNSNTYDSGFYGILGPNSDIKDGVYKLPFSYIYNGTTSEATCFYMRVNPPAYSIQDLEFRTIDVDNPFVGKSGNGRKPGSNWSVARITNLVMTERNDSNNKKGTEPLYKIILTPEKIKEIRRYNKNTEYGKHDVVKKKDVYVSKFLTDTDIFTAEDIQRKTPLWESVYNKEIEGNFELGDANQDGKVSIQDSTLIQKYLYYTVDTEGDTENNDANENTYNRLDIDLQAADINEDGLVNLLDAEKIREIAARLPVTQ